MTHRLTPEQYRQWTAFQRGPDSPSPKRERLPAVTPAALRQLQGNVADPAKAGKRKAPAGRERDVLRAITDYLSVELGPEGRGWFRMNAGLAEREGRRIQLAPEGTADLLAVIPAGRRVGSVPCLQVYDVALLFWIEVKRKGARTEKIRTTRQWEFRCYMQDIGCIAIEARSLEDVTAVLPPRGRR